jgi:hypothetical protein
VPPPPRGAGLAQGGFSSKGKDNFYRATLFIRDRFRAENSVIDACRGNNQKKKSKEKFF